MAQPIDPNTPPLTREMLAAQFRALGVQPAQSILLHSSLKRLGWVVGGAVTVVHALLDALGEGGTLMVPTHSADNSDPRHWENPPVPESWWQTVRDHTPAYHPAYSPTWFMGVIADTARQFPGARRSNHPQHSFAAVGANRDALVGGETPIETSLGDGSPLAALYALDGYVLLLGVGHDNNTSLHLSEHRANFPKKTVQEGAAVFVDGVRQWVPFEDIDLDDEDFPTIGVAFEAAHPDAVRAGTIGKAAAKLIRQRPLVDFGVAWMETNRTGSQSE